MNSMTLPISEDTKARVGRVGVLYGGLSSEREVSLQSGAAVITALESAGVEVVGIDIGANAIDQIREAGISRAFIALHGPGGEDGRMQAVLEFLNIAYTGSNVQASALAMNKLHSKQLWCGVDLPTAQFSILDTGSNWEKVLSDLGGEVMVKPVHEGSSIGMAKVSTAKDLKNAFADADELDDCVIAERLITGAEYTVAILDGEVLPPIKLETDNSFYDYEAKYLSEETRYLCPCGLPSAKEKELKDLALRAFNSLGCRGWGRIDFMADEQGQFYLLEANTVPGMTSHSLVPMAAQAANISFEQLVLKILLVTLSDKKS